jgi:hypothetical protein
MTKSHSDTPSPAPKNEPPVCKMCGDEYFLHDFDYEPTDYCDPCAQELVPELLDALRGLMNLTDQWREGGLILYRADQKPMTNGNQDIIDNAYIAASSALKKAGLL